MVPPRRAWTCTACGTHVYPTAGTIFEKSATGLLVWFNAAALLVALGGNVTVKELERQLGVSHKTAGRIRAKLLKTMPDDLRDLVTPQEPGDGRAADLPPSTLPVELTRFVGRRDEIRTVSRLLRSHRLVTLVGTGGCGKTRLALRVAAATPGEDAEGVWLIDLTSLTAGESVAVAFAAHLGLADIAGSAPMDMLVQQLGPTRALVILDNCEHVLDDCATVAQRLLAACANLRILATSRQRLGAAGEMAWTVLPLSIPRPGAGTAQSIARSDAVRLFRDRAQKVEPTFRIDDANADAVAGICRRLDGLPLAIELAAARTDALSPQQIETALVDCFAVLTRGDRSLPRQQSLRGSMQWSHDLLQAPEKILFRRLAVFAGSFSLEAVSAVCAGDGLDPRHLLAGLTDLVAKSLVTVDKLGPSYRYRLLETVGQYARERLGESGEVGRLHDRHLAYVMTLPARHGLAAENQTDWLDRLEREHANVAVALDWSCKRSASDSALQLVNMLGPFFFFQGRAEEGRRRFMAALATSHPGPSPQRALATWGLAYLCFLGSDIAGARQHAAAAMAMAQTLNDIPTLAKSLDLLGNIQIWTNPQAARMHLDESARLARSLGDGWGAAGSLGKVAMSWLVQGELEPARHCLAAAQEAPLDLRNRFQLAWHALGRALLALGMGDLVEAGSAAGRAAVLAAEVGNPMLQAWAGRCSAEVQCWRGQPAQALDALSALRSRHWLSTRSPFAAMLLHVAQGSAYLCIGQLGDAEAALRSGLEIASAAGNNHVMTDCLLHLAEAALLLGRWDLASAHCDEAARWAAVLGSRSQEAAAAVLLGRLHHASGESARAQAACHRALVAQLDGGHRLAATTTLETIAALCTAEHRFLKAARLFSAADAARRGLGLRRRPLDVLRHGAARSQLTRALDLAPLRNAVRDGARLTLEDAAAYASRGRGKQDRPAAGWDSLTPTQRAVAGLAAQGLTNPEIAARMFISRTTVKVHLTQIYSKLDLTNRAQLAAETTRQNR